MDLAVYVKSVLLLPLLGGARGIKLCVILRPCVCLYVHFYICQVISDVGLLYMVTLGSSGM